MSNLTRLTSLTHLTGELVPGDITSTPYNSPTYFAPTYFTPSYFDTGETPGQDPIFAYKFDSLEVVGTDLTTYEFDAHQFVMD